MMTTVTPFSSATVRSAAISVGVLKPDREPHQSIADAEFGACRRGQPLMSVVAGWVMRLLASPRLFGDVHELSKH